MASDSPIQPQWEGLGGLRLTGIGRIDPIRDEYSEAEIIAWMEASDLPPLLPGETFVNWSRRTSDASSLGHLGLESVVNFPKEK